MSNKEIEINRNIIEQFLMKVREIVKEYKKEVLTGLAAAGVLTALIIGGFVFYETKEKGDIAEFESILSKYKSSTVNDGLPTTSNIKSSLSHSNDILA